MLDALTAVLLHHNGYVLPFSLHSSLLTTAMTGVSQIWYLHLPPMRRHSPWPRSPYLLREEHIHGRL